MKITHNKLSISFFFVLSFMALSGGRLIFWKGFSALIALVNSPTTQPSRRWPFAYLPSSSSNPYGHLDYRFTASSSPMSYSGNSRTERVSHEDDAVNSEHLCRRIKGRRINWLGQSGYVS